MHVRLHVALVIHNGSALALAVPSSCPADSHSRAEQPVAYPDSPVTAWQYSADFPPPVTLTYICGQAGQQVTCRYAVGDSFAVNTWKGDKHSHSYQRGGQ